MSHSLTLLVLVQLAAGNMQRYTCRHVDAIMVPLKSPDMCCADPLVAAIAYVVGSAPSRGPCVMYNANHRFDRFREWLTLLGGHVSEKISFHRGHFVDQHGRAQTGYGGIFLNPNEHLRQGEMLFVVPDEATLNDRMILRAYPWFTRFEYGSSNRLWLSLGLAALLKHNPEYVAPWQALLPDLSDHPLIRPKGPSDLWGTQAGLLVHTTHSYINSGCRNFQHTYMAFLEISCKDVHEAHAIIASRAFGLERLAGSHEMSSSIPFGPDLLNHSPHSVSWTSQVRYGAPSRPKQIETVFFLLGFTLSDSRELFNNYGVHALAHVLAMYGYTAPDSWDELVVHATPYALLDGVRYEAVHGKDTCKSSVTIADVTGSNVCKKDIDSRRLPFDESGSFRLTPKDVVNIAPRVDFQCRIGIDSLVWLDILKKLADRLLHISYDQFVLALNGMDGSEPLLMFHDAVLMALCAFPRTGIPITDFVESATTCDPERDHYYLEEYPKGRLVRDLSRQGLYDLCAWYEVDVLGTLQRNLQLWIAYRNARIARHNKGSRLLESVVSFQFRTHVDFENFLAHVVDNKMTVFSDAGGAIDKTYKRAVSRMSTSRIEQLEEVFRYKMQTAFMVMRKCRQPLDLLVSDH